MNRFLKNNFGIIFILLVALFFRGINYADRIGFGQDSARDAIIALEAIRNQKLPLLGPPSSAWAFNFGPLYYHVIILFSLIIPGIFAPWIGFTFLSLLTVLLVYKTGEVVFDKKFGLIAALLCAISFGEIANSANLLNTMLVSFASALAFFALAKTLASKSKIFPILLGFAIALALNSHLQSMSLVVLIPLTAIFFPGKLKHKMSNFLFMTLGFITGFIPLLIFEFQHNLAWVKSILDYSLNGQKKFYTPVRWLTEFSVFWPEIFGKVLSGIPRSGYLYSGLIALSFAITFLKKMKLPKFFFIVAITFIFEIISVRYYKGPRSPEYFMIAHQFAIFFLAFAVWTISKASRVIGIIVLFMVVAISLKGALPLLTAKSDAPQILALFAQEKQFVGNRRIRLYGVANSFNASIATYYLSLKQGMVGEGELSLVVCNNRFGDSKSATEYCPLEGRLFRADNLIMYELDSFSEEQKAAYKMEELRGDVYYGRTYNNYELIKW